MSDNIPILNTELDQNWYLQGRIIPPSCASGDGCVLHLQTRFHTWAEGHFHTGRVPINCEAGVEFVTTLLRPLDDDLVRESLDSKEQDKDIEYLAMAKLVEPTEAIAFPTISGLTIVVHSPGLAKLFGPLEKCENCKAQEQAKAIMVPVSMTEEAFDPLMQITGDEKNH